ncbi:MAG TPA: Crp/Fnr family transcriptional regulator [Gemmataceae bacterium]|nr:Crp/Fnr family transcriptional regulator [Gemmataceae bacterium]
MSEKIWFLKRCDLFEGLAPAERERLEGHALLRNFKRGEIIYSPTESGQTVLVLARGRVKIKALGQDGKESILAFIDEGELFGELALLDSEPRNDFAEAVEASVVVAVPCEDMLWLIGRRPDIALYVTKLIGLRRRRIENRLRNILFRSTRERVVALLLELLESHGQAAGPHWEIRLKLSHQELANLIGATRETVTLTLGRLQAERFIRVRRRQIVILDRNRLAEELGTGQATEHTQRGGGKACDSKALGPH